MGLNIRAEAEIASPAQRSPESVSLEDTQGSREFFKISNPVLLLSALTIFLLLIEGGATHFPVLVVRVLLVVSVMVWTFGQMKRQAMTLPRSNLFLVAVLFLGWAGLTLCWTPYQDVSVQSFMNLLMSLLLYGVVLQGIRSDRQVRQIVSVLIGMGLIEGLLGIVQYFFLDEARARGTFFNPNYFALQSSRLEVDGLRLEAHGARLEDITLEAPGSRWAELPCRRADRTSPGSPRRCPRRCR